MFRQCVRLPYVSLGIINPKERCERDFILNWNPFIGICYDYVRVRLKQLQWKLEIKLYTHDSCRHVFIHIDLVQVRSLSLHVMPVVTSSKKAKKEPHLSFITLLFIFLLIKVLYLFHMYIIFRSHANFSMHFIWETKTWYWYRKTFRAVLTKDASAFFRDFLLY